MVPKVVLCSDDARSSTRVDSAVGAGALLPPFKLGVEKAQPIASDDFSYP